MHSEIFLCIDSHFSDQRLSAPVDNQNYVLASHECLPIHVDLCIDSHISDQHLSAPVDNQNYVLA